jgi:hypothetical protein
MGIHLEMAPHLYRLMSPEDQERYGIDPSLWESKATAQDPKDDTHPPVKSGSPEKVEQASFANYMLEKNAKRGPNEQIPWVWHDTHRKSRATPGTPDFYVGINGHSIWLEFKRDYSCELSPPQEIFRLACQAQQIEHHVVYSAFQAIRIIEEADALTV